MDRKFDYPTRIAFAHPVYQDAENYPRGFADIAGYWAESKIFGGVVLFDRGEREQEVKQSFRLAYLPSLFSVTDIFP